MHRDQIVAGGIAGPAFIDFDPAEGMFTISISSSTVTVPPPLQSHNVNVRVDIDVGVTVGAPTT